MMVVWEDDLRMRWIDGQSLMNTNESHLSARSLGAGVTEYFVGTSIADGLQDAVVSMSRVGDSYLMGPVHEVCVWPPGLLSSQLRGIGRWQEGGRHLASHRHPNVRGCFEISRGGCRVDNGYQTISKGSSSQLIKLINYIN